MSTLLIVLLVVFLFGGIGTYPGWDHSREYGYGPSFGFGFGGLIVLILVILFLTGRISF